MNIKNTLIPLEEPKVDTGVQPKNYTIPELIPDTNKDAHQIETVIVKKLGFRATLSAITQSIFVGGEIIIQNLHESNRVITNNVSKRLQVHDGGIWTDSNTIMVEPTKSREGTELTRA